MPNINFDDLLNAGVHFGHLKRKWNPNMAPYIFMERNGIHIIDLHKTIKKVEEVQYSLKNLAKSGRKILFVGTKKQAKDIISEKAKEINMPYVIERWSGGMLTNFPTIRKAIKRMSTIDKMATNGTFENMSKRERLQITRQREKLEKNLGSIADMIRLPAAIFVVDINKEYIAVNEARKLNIPVYAIIDTNTDPTKVDYGIPANDDASASIDIILSHLVDSIKEGLSERKLEREKNAEDKRKKTSAKKEVKSVEKAIDKKDEIIEKVKKSPAKKKTTAKKENKPDDKKPVAKKESKLDDKKPAAKKESKLDDKKPVAKKSTTAKKNSK